MMELEFDKEMDVLLRQAAQGETVFDAQNPKSEIRNPKFAHLDADEISAFAEDALPSKTKQIYFSHFADCGKCRKILAEVVRLNLASENEFVTAPETKIATAQMPWYRRLFVFPNLAYTLGALIVAFAGIIAFTVLQSVKNMPSAEVSQISDKQTGGQQLPASDGFASPETSGSAAENTNAMSSNSTSNSMTANTAAMNKSEPNANLPVAADKSSNAAIKPNVLNEQSPQAVVRANDDAILSKTEAQTPSPDATMGSVMKKDKSAEDNKTSSDDAESDRAKQPAPKSSAPVAPERRAMSSEEMLKTRKNAPEKAETISVGGKDFRRENGVYVDAAYNGQSTANISRGTKEYKKLDAKLRGIVENLGGTVIIVWKEKTYKIQ